MKTKNKIPMRQCTGCREMKNKNLEKARKNHGLERSLKAAIPDEVYDSLEKEFDSIEE